MNPHTLFPPEGSEQELVDFECELACGDGADELGYARTMMRSWVGTVVAAMPHEAPAEPRAGRCTSGYSVAALHARIAELARENLALRIELVRRLRIEAELRTSKRNRRRALRFRQAMLAPGHDLMLAPQPEPQVEGMAQPGESAEAPSQPVRRKRRTGWPRRS